MLHALLAPIPGLVKSIIPISMIIISSHHVVNFEVSLLKCVIFLTQLLTCPGVVI